MAFRRHMVLALAFLPLIAAAPGCTDDTTAPNTQDEAPLLPPSNVQAVVINGGDIEISWDPSSQPGVRGYHVYRQEVGAGIPIRINPSRVVTTSYLDENALVSREYEYRVTAVGSKGTESRYTAVVIQNQTVIGDGRDRVPGPAQD